MRRLGSFSNIVTKIKKEIARFSISFLIVCVFTLLSFFNRGPIGEWVNRFNSIFYDFQVRSHHRPLEKEIPITIVDIDDKSLQAKGRWPWPRKLLSDLATGLFKDSAGIVAFDMLFPESEENLALDILKEIKKEPDKYATIQKEIEGLERQFNYDELFATSLQLGDSVLGLIFSDQGASAGLLPSPFIVIDPQLETQLAIPEKREYLSNIEMLQKAAKGGGFINSDHDLDGELRFSNLLFKHGTDIYASLALFATSKFLLTQKIELITAQYQNTMALEGIKLDQLTIPTDPLGRILIPYRGIPFSFPYVSAADVLDGKVDPALIQGKLIFIGFSASALTDLHTTPMSTTFPGVEVHATIASGIIDQYLPFKPYWGKGVITFIIVVCGLICTLLLPFFGAIANILLVAALTAGIMQLDSYLWNQYGMVLAILLPLALVWILFVFNIAWGYFSEARRGQELKSIFGQYVPSAYLEELIKKGGAINLEGESKELTVLFSDIRSFTTLSEKMTASELKIFLNRFFNPITEIIFKNKGTIDKYVGDMVMAFWGAPLEDPQHALQAVSTALEMQARLKQVNEIFAQEGKPKIKIGIGVNTGLMNVGDMGSTFRRAYTVIGDSVNLASRLEGQSKYYHVDILVGENTWQQSHQAFAFRKIDKIKVKGKEKGVMVFQPICKIDELPDSIKKEIETHNQALEAYFKQEWDISLSLFEQLKHSDPDNADLYDVYLVRILKLRKQPYREDWDGSYISLEK